MSDANTRTQSEWVQVLYDRRALTYDESFHPSFAAYIVAQLDLQPGDRVLDLACGTGLCTLAAAQQVAPAGRVVGVDASSGMLGVARSKESLVKAQEVGVITLLNHDILDLDSLPTLKSQLGAFDAIICASALVLLSDPLQAIALWAQYLKPGGKLIVDTPHEKNQPAGITLERAARKCGLPIGYNRLWVESEDSLRGVLDAARGEDGRKLLEVESIHFKEQVGYGTRRHDGGDDEAKETLKKWGGLGGFDAEACSLLESTFVEEWSKRAEADGSVLDIDGVYIAIATRV